MNNNTLNKELKSSLIKKLENINIRVPSSIKKADLVELLLLNANNSTLEEQKLEQTSFSTTAQHQAYDDSSCLHINKNDDYMSENDKMKLINRILDQNQQILAQNESLLSFLLSSNSNDKENKQTRYLNATAPDFISHHLNSSFLSNRHSLSPDLDLGQLKMLSTSQMTNESQKELTAAPSSLINQTSNSSDLKQKTNKIILGDSLLKNLDQKFLSTQNCNVNIRTKSGEKFSKLIEKIKSNYEEFVKESDSVVYVCGTNDISDGTVSKTIEEAQTLVKLTKQTNPNIKISLTSVPFRSRKLNQGGFDKISNYNKQLKQVCLEENVNFIRLNFERGMLKDGLHPNFFGCRVMYDRFSNCL
ncbi:unnamed protein product [Didymodactylos carnosus]|uniref:SGNH hydrolase-type esterase domain-containing protein n=1 Tax=Didymodactylos carnosus TaxID=1234261 RepID=A0A814IHJ5_9BILA|nr:unnamed protein product [Didymodactylos carnosus]CAF1162697.1 unnamed protein product [Didymodactylos carnosus]CAF3795770.1 unnamed protein product [Didymodactylos carnosus]CAF3974388.1 unnamed protein product [Didymodactylos carnosus]